LGTTAGAALRAELCASPPPPLSLESLQVATHYPVATTLSLGEADSYNILLILYDAATAGNNLCQSASVALTLANGHFSVPLPDACTTAIGANPSVWVDVLVDGSDTGRTKIGAVPYAVEANHAVNATNATTATNATSATSATTATNCTNATNATNASNAAGALGTTLSAIQGDVSTLQSSVSGVQQADTNFVDLSSNQTVGVKTFVDPIYGTLADGAFTGGTGAAIVGHAGHAISFSWDGAAAQLHSGSTKPT